MTKDFFDGVTHSFLKNELMDKAEIGFKEKDGGYFFHKNRLFDLVEEAVSPYVVATLMQTKTKVTLWKADGKTVSNINTENYSEAGSYYFKAYDTTSNKKYLKSK